MRINQFMYFYPEAPKLCHVESELFQRLSTDDDWVAEKKYNEQRLQLHCNGKFDFWNRHNARLNYEPDTVLSEALTEFNDRLKGYCLFDGGLRHNKTIGVKHKIIIYDIYAWDSRMLLTVPFKERRAMIEDLAPCDEQPVRIPEQYAGCFEQMFYRVIDDDEIEGLVMKNLKGKIAPGRNHRVNSVWMFKAREPSGRYKF